MAADHLRDHDYAAGIGYNSTKISDNSVEISDDAAGSLWNLSSRNRVTPVSIQDGVRLGITFAVISTIPVASSPISVGLSPIPEAIGRPRGRRSLRDLLNTIKHC